MAGSWVKLGDIKWQFIPQEVKNEAHKLDLTWAAASSMTKTFFPEGPSEEALAKLGAYTSDCISLKPRHATGSSIDIVEFTPRSATTAKVRSAIKLTPAMPAIKLTPAADVKPPPGNFETTKPPGNFDTAKPPGNFNTAKPPDNFDEPASSRGSTPLVPINHGEEEEEQTTKSVPGVNTWWQASDIEDYLETTKPGAIQWYPWNAYIFDSVTDFVSSLRAEASMPGAHFKWPEQRMTYEMMIAQAIHHLPPGHHVSIKNGNLCPKKLLNDIHEWGGELTEYYHGTTAHNLLRGIIRDGLKPTFGAGAEATETAWGQKTPMVYLSRSLECASNFPLHDAMLAADKYENHGLPYGGEIISRDGTPPIRVMLRCISGNTRQLWHKHTKTNDQRGFMPKHVYVPHIIIYALPPVMAAGWHTHITWQMYTSTGQVATSDNLMTDESSSANGPRNGRNQWLVPEVYGIGKMLNDPIEVDITKKDMLTTRMNHRQTAIIKKWIKVIRDPETGKTMPQEDLPEQVRFLLDMNPRQDMVPVLEHTNYSLKNREESNYHTVDEITKILANHQLGNSVAELLTQKSKPEETKADKSTESSVGKSATQKKSEWKDWGDSSWPSQSWGANDWSSNSWHEKSDNKKQKTSDSEKKERDWRKRQAVAYTTHYRGILTVIKPFPAFFYGINRGTYVSPEPGQHGDPTTVYPIPSGDRIVAGKSHPANLCIMDQDDNMSDKVTIAVWEVFRKQQDEEHRRGAKAALEDNKYSIAKAEADFEARQNDIKEKHVEKAMPNDNDDEAGVTNHGGTAADPWNKALTSFTHIPKTKKKGKNVIAAKGGLALTVLANDPDHAPADGNEWPSLGYDLGKNKKIVTREDKKIVTYEDKKITTCKDNLPNTQTESDTKSPNLDEMDIEERLTSPNDAVTFLAKDTDPESLMMLQNMLDVANIMKNAKPNPATSSSRSSTEAALHADVKMGDAAANLPTKIEGETPVDLEESEDLEEKDEIAESDESDESDSDRAY